METRDAKEKETTCLGTGRQSKMKSLCEAAREIQGVEHEDLYYKAQVVGIKGRSKVSKGELITLRYH